MVGFLYDQIISFSPDQAIRNSAPSPTDAGVKIIGRVVVYVVTL